MTAPELSAREREIVARFEAGEAAPESFDATAALRRVLELADEYDLIPLDHAEARRLARKVADRIRAALNGQPS